jgi:hypothetical protein
LEFNNIVNNWNQHDAGTLVWNVVNTNSLIAKGTTTNDSPSAGYLGEVIQSVAGPTNITTQLTWQDLTSISLTAGDWMVDGNLWVDQNTATPNQMRIAITSTSGNSTVGMVNGSNMLPQTMTGAGGSSNISGLHIQLASTTVYYLKMWANPFSSGNPAGSGRITAIRVR